MRIKIRSYIKYIYSISRICICMLLIDAACLPRRKATHYKLDQTNNACRDISLHIAVKNADLVTVNQLCLDTGINVNETNKYGDSPVHFAAQKGDLQIVKALLSHKDLNVNKQNYFGQTALDIASQSGHEDVVALLLKSGAIRGE